MISQLTPEQKANAKKVLKEALKLILKGWTKGALAINKDKMHIELNFAVKQEDCKFCAVGAIEGAAELVRSGGFETSHAKAVLREQLPKRANGGYAYIVNWNDAEERRKPEVVAAFRSAIKALD